MKWVDPWEANFFAMSTLLFSVELIFRPKIALPTVGMICAKIAQPFFGNQNKVFLKRRARHGSSNRTLVGSFLFDTLRYQVKSFQKVALENVCFFICCLRVQRVCFDPKVSNQEFWKNLENSISSWFFHHSHVGTQTDCSNLFLFLFGIFSGLSCLHKQ